MIKTFDILLPPYENEIKIWKVLGKWVYWVWVRVYPKPIIFMGFSFFKTISTQSPYPTHFFGFFLGGFDGFFGFTQPMYTPIRNRWINCLESIRNMNFLVSHIYREGNSCAHGLTNLGLALSSLVWFPPDYVRNRLGLPKKKKP